MKGGQLKEAIVGGGVASERAVKSLWSQWDRLLFRNRVLCRKWENDIGDQTNNQIVLPAILRQTAFEAHHSHTTASHRGVRKTIKALQSRYYWPGLTSAVHGLVASCHVCENMGKEASRSFTTVRGRSSHGTHFD